MSDVVLKVENLYKRYRLGTVDRQAFKEDVASWWAKLRGKPDPYEQYITSNELANIKDSESMKHLKARYVWALQDINFEVKRGEIVGIIGKNGAGKSTLLKILSKTTTPTKGQVKVKGRIASLLEVGTGFHGELTGRENIYLNGAILGMTRHEITRHLDEIIDFAGVEAYIDTPVKRYSSGMYVRLAFAVGAHLLSDILIVDEVLAVGDAEFQKKCIGKMKDVSTGEGKTVLFVSHNMVSVNSLCSTGIYLRNGKIEFIGNVRAAINKYLSNENANVTIREWNTYLGDDEARLISAKLIDENYNHITVVDISQKFGIEYEYEVVKNGAEKIPNIHLYNSKGECVFVSGEKSSKNLTHKGRYKTILWIPSHLLNDGTYIAGIALSTMIPLKVHFFDKEAIVFNVIENVNGRDNLYNQAIPGVIRPKLEWQTQII
ncbi:ABC transporter ATP-binding protein [Thermoflexibacter ruber]|uniref:Lipopolysaccharide transport system ATP-binding protein n=1 Tax=Thermoflexibacter ruber TaxID=1003 RepID=A0A1I2GMM9_9BACT|nr:ABC transporter ATP-binding protein [Thermoflexibacter ruber]SFF18087.1 lipopolysaccharide transport system ATP-binding protein [Thermoflexibacter ruber]